MTETNTSVPAAPVRATQLFQIDVTDTSPERAKAVADEIAHQLVVR